MEVKEVLRFLKDLSKNNNREWMQQNDDRYKAIRVARDTIADNFIAAVSRVEPEASMLTARDVTYRLMRDTRFSGDKTPYKTHLGIFVCPPYGKKSLLSGYYLHLEPGKCFICGGNYCLPTPLLGVIRRDIRDNIEEYVGIVESPEFRQYFTKIGEERLKTAPKGFDRDWEYIDYVRPKDFGVEMPLADSFFNKRGWMDELHPVLEQIKRLNDFINFSITESGMPVMREGRR